jgi:hypothetical protein
MMDAELWQQRVDGPDPDAAAPARGAQVGREQSLRAEPALLTA